MTPSPTDTDGAYDPDEVSLERVLEDDRIDEIGENRYVVRPDLEYLSGESIDTIDLPRPTSVEDDEPGVPEPAVDSASTEDATLDVGAGADAVETGAVAEGADILGTRSGADVEIDDVVGTRSGADGEIDDVVGTRSGADVEIDDVVGTRSGADGEIDDIVGANSGVDGGYHTTEVGSNAVTTPGLRGQKRPNEIGDVPDADRSSASYGEPEFTHPPLDATPEPHGADLTLKTDGEVSHLRVTSNDVRDVFCELLTWYASQLDDDLSPVETLQVLLATTDLES